MSDKKESGGESFRVKVHDHQPAFARKAQPVPPPPPPPTEKQ